MKNKKIIKLFLYSVSIFLLINIANASTKDELRQNLIERLNAYFENPSANPIDINEINGQIEILFGTEATPIIGTASCQAFGGVTCNADQYFDNGKCIDAKLPVDFKVSALEGTAPLDLSFDCKGINEFGPYSYTLDFGDGQIYTLSDGSNIKGLKHTFAKPGTYKAICTVVDTKSINSDYNCDGFSDRFSSAGIEISALAPKCRLTDAKWSKEEANKGERVNLIVVGENCEGKSVKFNVVEDDMTDNDPINVNPEEAKFLKNQADGIWTAEWQDDGIGDPEYFFTAIAEDVKVKSSNNLKVSEPVISCTENWQCAEWSSCINGQQTRSCIDTNNCRTTNNKPGVVQSCTMPTEFCDVGAGQFQPIPNPIPSNEINYPFVIEKIGESNKWLMFTGGFAHKATAEMLSTTPERDSSHIKYLLAQEEIWISDSNDLITWSTPRFAFRIKPDTPVTFKGNRPYSEVYPTGFGNNCQAFQNGQCNVQINDPSVVKIIDANGEHYYMYFSILENSRWHSGQYGTFQNGQPTNPAEQNMHSIGLAVSDDLVNWAFVDKVIPENPQNYDKNEPVLGAWSPSAVAVGRNTVDIYFNDALGTKQYVAYLLNGASLQSIQRLNKNDETFRVNLDVIKPNEKYEVAFNDVNFGIQRMKFTRPEDFGTLCQSEVVVPAAGEAGWPTPNQLLDKEGKVHLFFWGILNQNFIHHWLLQP